MLKGIDVSEHQGRIDWDRVKGNIDFAIIRAGYGRNNIDKQFHRNISECNRLGIPCGIYWFSYALNPDMARQEARYALAAIRNYRLDYPIAYDFEYDTINYANKKGVTLGRRTATDMVKAFCSEIEAAGYYAINYANPDFVNNKFYQEELKRYSLWLAWYGASEAAAKKYGCLIWQYSESGSVPGIGTNSVDMNYAYEDFAKIIAGNKLNGNGGSAPKPTTPAPQPTPEPSPEAGYGIITGNVVNVRKGASLSSDIIGTVKKGERVKLANKVGKFWSTYWGPNGGFIHADYISTSGGSNSSAPTPGTSGNVKRVTAKAGLNVRKGPGTSYAIIGGLPYNSTVKVDNYSGDWASIFFGSNGGWVNRQYLE